MMMSIQLLLSPTPFHFDSASVLKRSQDVTVILSVQRLRISIPTVACQKVDLTAPPTELKPFYCPSPPEWCHVVPQVQSCSIKTHHLSLARPPPLYTRANNYPNASKIQQAWGNTLSPLSFQVRLDVGGQRFHTARRTLTQEEDSMQASFSNR